MDPPAKWQFDSIFRQFITYFAFILYFICDYTFLYLRWMLDSYLELVRTFDWLHINEQIGPNQFTLFFCILYHFQRKYYIGSNLHCSYIFLDLALISDT